VLHRLSVKLMLAIGLLTALIFGMISSITWTLHQGHLNAEVTRHAALLSETILLTLRDAMLENRFAEVDSVVDRIQTQPGIDHIRIFDKSGSILLSTDHDEVNSTVPLSNDQCIGCHIDGTPKVVLANPERTYIIDDNSGIPVLGMITPIRNEPDCSQAPCHAHPADKSILGVLDVNLSLEKTRDTLSDEAWKFTLVSALGCLLIVAATGLSLWRLVYRPIHDLTVGTQQLSAGNLDYRLPQQDTDEFSALVQSFDRMTADLRNARDEVHNWNRMLEERVEEKSLELQEAQEQMIQTEKMASLGKLAAVVAHEINNPLAGILTYMKLLRRMLRKPIEEFDTEKADGYLGMSETETMRVGNIVKNLLAFSRPSSPEKQTTDVNAIIERSQQLVGHQLNLQNVQQVADLEQNLPHIKADPNQIQQVVLAILINAVEAMPQGGLIRIASNNLPDECAVRFCVSDSGVGIPEETITRLFEPFFTTKTEGKGVGLGLFVVYGIVRRHGGTIEVKSEQNEGTSFIVRLPVDGPPEDGKLDSDGHPIAVFAKGTEPEEELPCREALRLASLRDNNETASTNSETN
jgi:two-component system, NtrC family, sensor kinase